MNNIYNLFLLLIAHSIAGDGQQHIGALPCALTDKESSMLLSLARAHRLVGVLYPSVIRICNLTEEQRTAWEHAMMPYLFLATKQENEVKNIARLLSEKEIAYTELKGVRLRRLYPDGLLRTSADIDFLYSLSARDEVARALQEEGYRLQTKGTNHDTFVKGNINLEMHHALADQHDNLRLYYRDIDRRLIATGNGTERKMSDEDFFIFHVIHTMKHFSEGGIGIRALLDHYLLRTRGPALDDGYVEQELQKLNLVEFTHTLDRLARHAFESANTDVMSNDDRALLAYFFESGAFGTPTHKVAMSGRHARATKKAGIRFIFRRLFPTYSFMKGIFPALRHLPFLLPFFWIFRILRAIFTERRVLIGRDLEAVGDLKEKDLARAERVRRLAGLQ